MTDDGRISKLEESVFFQERLLADLNSALTSQQRQIDTLEEAVRRLHLQVKSLAEQSGEGPANLPPPHYSSV